MNTEKLETLKSLIVKRSGKKYSQAILCGQLEVMATDAILDYLIQFNAEQLKKEGK